MAQRRRAERRLQRTVARYTGCLDNLSSARRRVLELRAGVGSADPASRRGVARRLDISVTRVRRLERGGLRRVRLLARTDGCGGALTSAGPDETASGAPVLSAASLSAGNDGSGSGGGGTSGAGGSPDGNDPGSGSESGAGESGEVLGESATNPPPAFGGPPRDIATGTSIWVGIALIVLAALAGFATPSIRDRLRGSGSTSGAH